MAEDHTQERLTLCCRKPEAEKILRTLEPYEDEDGLPLSYEQSPEGEWTISLYVPQAEADDWEARLRDRLGADLFGLALEREVLPDVDWVSRSQEALAPVRAGRFILHGSHDAPRFAARRSAVLVDAGQAFGTGHHGTTAGCLDVLETVLPRLRPERVIDLGTGSGVLAIAVARTLPAHVLATDIDALSIKVARRNARLNGVADRIRFAVADGMHHPEYVRFGRADLTIANILAGPLAALAPDIIGATRRGGEIVLSGLLPHQEAMVIAAYRLRRCRLLRRYRRDGWSVLHLQRG